MGPEYKSDDLSCLYRIQDLCYSLRNRSFFGQAPSGIATDDLTKDFFQDLVKTNSLVSLYDFENRKGIFPSVDSRYKFALLTLTGSERPRTSGADFVFYALEVTDLADTSRHFTLTASDIEKLNPNTGTCPIFRSRYDADLTLGIYGTHEIIRHNAKGGSHNIRITRMFDMNKQRPLFDAAEELETIAEKKLSGHWITPSGNYLPLVEGKTFASYDHRNATPALRKDGGIRTGTAIPSTPEKLADPTFIPDRLLYMHEAKVDGWADGRLTRRWVLALINVTSATNHRTAVSAILPDVVTDYSVRIVVFNYPDARHASCLLGLFNSFPFDYVVRQKLQGLNFSDYITYQIAVPSKDTLLSRADFIVSRVIELSYTAWDLEPFATDCGYHGLPFRWDEERRFLLRCELDAAYFHLYGIERDDVDYILETFPIVKRKDEQAHGEYRTKRVILDIYDAMQQAMETGMPYHTRLDPPPAHGWTPPEVTLEAVTARQDDSASEDTANVSADLQRRAASALSQPAFHFDNQTELAES